MMTTNYNCAPRATIGRLFVAIALAIGMAMPCAKAATQDAQANKADTSTKGLPLIELPAIGAESDTFVVFLSGDGGWGQLNKIMASTIRRRGEPVVGWNCFRYLWHARTPDEAGRDMERLLRHYLAAWHKDKVILLGYSLGADLLPAMASRLSEDVRKHISLVCLMGPSPQTGMEFHFMDWFNSAPRGPQYPLKPDVEKLKTLNVPVTIVYGEHEKDSLVPLLAPEAAKLIVRPGKHHFGGNYRELANLILDEAATPTKPQTKR